MGTAVRFVVDDEVDAGAAIQQAIRWLHWVDETFSVHRADSQIMQLRRGELADSDVDLEVAWVLGRCAALRMFTDAAFDHRPDEALDPSGYVKGWAVQRAAGILEEAGLHRFFIDAGGDIVVRGTWRVGIKDPAQPTQPATVLELCDVAIATSGTYERGNHIWGSQAERPGSLSVIGPDLGTADALATALWAGGGRGAAWMERFPDYDVVGLRRPAAV